MLLKTDASQRGGAGFGETSTGASVAKGEFERRARASWFPGEPFPAPPGRLGVPLPSPRHSARALCQHLSQRSLSIEPLEQDPTFTVLFIQSPWQRLGNDAEEREGSRKEGTEDTKARHMGLECVSESLVSPGLWESPISLN